MTGLDVFFTHTAVGQALSATPGRRLRKVDAQGQETMPVLAANMATATLDLLKAWKDGYLIQGAWPQVSLPGRKPARTHRRLARHALISASVYVLLILILPVSLSGFAALIVWPLHSLKALVDNSCPSGMPFG